MTASHKSDRTKEEVVVAVAKIGDLSQPDWAAIKAILQDGDAVNVQSALNELPVASKLVLARRGGAIVGLGAIKRERPAYTKQVQEKAGHSFDTKTGELGYVAIDRHFIERGISSRIVDTLLNAYSAPLFSTTDNDRMKSCLTHRGFKQVGDSWSGNRGKLSLWLREAAGT